jgi:hypothetical protein
MSTPEVVKAWFSPGKQVKRWRGEIVPIPRDCTEQQRQGQRTNQQFLWIKSPELNFLQFTWFYPGFSGF